MNADKPSGPKFDLGNRVGVETFYADREKLITKEKTHRSGMALNSYICLHTLHSRF